MTVLVVIGCMVIGGCIGGSIGSFEDRGSDLPGFGFMFFGLMGVIVGAIVGAVVAQAIA